MEITHVLSSIIHNTQEVETTQVSVSNDSERIKCGVYAHAHTEEYDSALKRREILSHDTIWMNLRDIMVSEISQSQKCTYTPYRNIKNKRDHFEAARPIKNDTI